MYVPLLTIESERLLLELTGPQIDGLNATAPAMCNLVVVRPTAPAPIVQIQDSGTQPRILMAGDNVTAFLQEETTYTLFVQAKKSDQVALTTRDPRIFTKVRSHARNLSQRSGDFTFTRQVGHFAFSVSDGVETWRIEVEVFPSKIDYKTDYENLVTSLEGHLHALTLANFRATHRPAASTAHTVAPGKQVEWLTLVRHYIDDLENALDQIAQQPHKTLRRREELTRAERVAKVDSHVAKQIASGRGAGGWEKLNDTTSVREKIWNNQIEETLDNSENRHIKRALERFLTKLREVRAMAKKEAGDPQHPQLAEIDQLITRAAACLTRPPFPEVSQGAIRMGASLTLVQKPGYRETYRTLRSLMDLIVAGNASVNASLKDLDVLYEAWCFVHVSDLVANSVPGARVRMQLAGDGKGRLGVAIARGASVVVKSKTRTVTVYYNRQTPGLTGSQRPDITVVVTIPGWDHLDIVVDAKYRVKHAASYVKEWGAPGPPREATDACHRYRDSIIDPDTSRRHTVCAVAAFPLGADDAAAFVQHPMYDAVGKIGVGALPLLPGNTELFDSWLLRMINAEASDLAQFGPAHASSPHATVPLAND